MRRRTKDDELDPETLAFYIYFLRFFTVVLEKLVRELRKYEAENQN